MLLLSRYQFRFGRLQLRRDVLSLSQQISSDGPYLPYGCLMHIRAVGFVMGLISATRSRYIQGCLRNCNIEIWLLASAAS